MKLKRIPTGIPGLDQLIGGGFPVNSTILMLSEASIYTELVLQQFIYQGLIDGFPALYISISQCPETVMKSMRLQGMDVDRYTRSRRLVFVDLCSNLGFPDEEEELPTVEKNIISIRNIDDPDMVMMAINAGLGTLGDLRNIRMVVDSTPEILAGLDMIEFLRFWRMVGNSLSSYDMNILYNYPVGIKDEYFRAASHHADVILRLVSGNEGQNIITYLYIDKMRFSTSRNISRVQMQLEDGRAKAITYNKIR